VSDAALDDTLRMLLDSAEAFLREAHSLKRVHNLRNEPDSFDAAMWGQMAYNGWLGICLPEALGGAGLGIEAAAELSALFGAALMPEPFALSAVAPASILAASNDTSMRSHLAQCLCDGTRVLTLAWQDALGQLEARWGGVTLVPERDGFRLHGRKMMVDCAATDWLVTAVQGTTPVVLAVARSAVENPDTMCRLADGSQVLSIDFDGFQVSSDAVLLHGEPARVAVNRALNDARLTTSAHLAGLAGKAMDLSAAYVSQRIQFGVPVSSFQVIRHRLVDLDLQRRLSFASWRHAARLAMIDNTSPTDLSLAVSAAKARCSETALLAARSAIQLHGAMGYTSEAEIGLFMDAALRHASALGNASAHRRQFLQRGALAQEVA
jgi:alkylation response protein AidB-like acyl-CoA dehydrogenase